MTLHKARWFSAALLVAFLVVMMFPVLTRGACEQGAFGPFDGYRFNPNCTSLTELNTMNIGTAPAGGKLLMSDSTDVRHTFYSIQTVCQPHLRLTNLDTDHDLFAGPYNNPIHVIFVGCSYDGTGTTVATIQLEDGAGNDMTHDAVTCVNSSSGNMSWRQVTAANDIASGESVQYDVTNTPAPSTDWYTICVAYTFDE